MTKLAAMITSIDLELAGFDAQITERFHHHESADILLSMPRFGPLLAATFLANIGGLDTWDEPDNLFYDRQLLSDLTSLRFTEAGHGVLILGAVGVGKTHLATAPGHIGIRRRLSVHASRTDKLFTRLRAARLDNTLEAKMRKLARVDLLILDDFALRSLDATQTNDFYEIVVERHRKAATIVTSNRGTI